MSSGSQTTQGQRCKEYLLYTPHHLSEGAVANTSNGGWESTRLCFRARINFLRQAHDVDGGQNGPGLVLKCNKLFFAMSTSCRRDSACFQGFLVILTNSNADEDKYHFLAVLCSKLTPGVPNGVNGLFMASMVFMVSIFFVFLVFMVSMVSMVFMVSVFFFWCFMFFFFGFHGFHGFYGF